ncbi:MAG: hypothetical protein JJU36_17920, partial [Phycisphaeraceae bacterium]|nr:hypothetical protein [Phycisphaeraceae bacterium]
STLGRQLSQWVDREVNVLLNPGNGSNPNEANNAAADASGDGEWFKVSLKQRTQRGRKRVYALHITPDLSTPAPGSAPGSAPGTPGSFWYSGSFGGNGSWPGPMPGW